MSTSGTPSPAGASSRPATGWFPNLQGLGLPSALTNGVKQSFTLIYSLRDQVNQLNNAANSMVQYGTHLNRVNTKAQAVADGALWFETDRQAAFYQARFSHSQTTRDWFYAGGIYADVMTKQPNDLNDTNDIGFLFLGIDAATLFRWTGTAFKWDPVLVSGKLSP